MIRRRSYREGRDQVSLVRCFACNWGDIIGINDERSDESMQIFLKPNRESIVCVFSVPRGFVSDHG